jgi:hypothetical protein
MNTLTKTPMFREIRKNHLKKERKWTVSNRSLKQFNEKNILAKFPYPKKKELLITVRS